MHQQGSDHSGVSIRDINVDTYKHIHLVRNFLENCAKELLTRGQQHDASKLVAPECLDFARFRAAVEGMAYGSSAYEAVRRDFQPLLERHFTGNPHHPEYHGAEGINAMTLFDLLEMLCDWQASAQRTPQGNVNLSANITRYGVDAQLARILANTLKVLGQDPSASVPPRPAPDASGRGV